MCVCVCVLNCVWPPGPWLGLMPRCSMSWQCCSANTAECSTLHPLLSHGSYRSTGSSCRRRFECIVFKMINYYLLISWILTQQIPHKIFLIFLSSIHLRSRRENVLCNHFSSLYTSRIEIKFWGLSWNKWQISFSHWKIPEAKWEKNKNANKTRFVQFNICPSFSQKRKETRRSSAYES